MGGFVLNLVSLAVVNFSYQCVGSWHTITSDISVFSFFSCIFVQPDFVQMFNFGLFFYFTHLSTWSEVNLFSSSLPSHLFDAILISMRRFIWFRDFFAHFLDYLFCLPPSQISSSKKKNLLICSVFDSILSLWIISMKPSLCRIHTHTCIPFWSVIVVICIYINSLFCSVDSHNWLLFSDGLFLAISYTSDSSFSLSLCLNVYCFYKHFFVWLENFLDLLHWDASLMLLLYTEVQSFFPPNNSIFHPHLTFFPSLLISAR